MTQTNYKFINLLHLCKEHVRTCWCSVHGVLLSHGQGFQHRLLIQRDLGKINLIYSTYAKCRFISVSKAAQVLMLKQELAKPDKLLYSSKTLALQTANPNTAFEF